MNAPSRVSITIPAYQLYLYRRPLHPELFALKGRRTLTHGAYELEAWIMPGAHALRFRHGAFCGSELVTDHDDRLPVDGAVTGFACNGEQEFEHKFVQEKVTYLTSVQTETLSENLYRSTYDEMIDYAKQTDALVHKWADDHGRKCLSLLDLQRLSKEVHVQGYHLIAGGGYVLRTQSIFAHA